MEFGKVTPAELDAVDLNLPADHASIQTILKAKPAEQTKLFIGCAKWGRKDWVGKIYPEKTKEADFLEHYGRHFNSIELNATFYRIPSKAQTASWAKKVGPDFRFCPKVSQSITHIRRLKNATEALDRFISGISGFGKNLGPLFLMLHPQMGPKSLDTLVEFLQSMPKEFKVFVEVRHAEWYSEANFNALLDALQKNGAGLVITDAAGRRDCVHMAMTLPETFVRFVGNDLHPTDYTRIDNWVRRINDWRNAGIESIYFFMHQNEEVNSPELCKYLINELNERCGLQIRLPGF